MGLSTSGFDGLSAYLDKLASSADGDALAGQALESGAEIIKQRMIDNASSNPQPRSGKLRSSIKVGGVKRKGQGSTVSVGVWSSDVKYAYPVEYGHGGPHPAPAHPFLRPAFNEGKEDAYSAIKSSLASALDK